MPPSRRPGQRVGHGVVLAAALALAAFPTSCSGNDESTVGEVLKVFDRKAYVDEELARRGDKLLARGVLTTDHSGNVEFELDSGTNCRTRSNSELEIEPGGGVRINFVHGSSFCRKDPDAPRATYRVGDKLLVDVDDPVFGVSIEPEQTVVRVTLGFVEVENEATEEPVVVGPQQQAVVSSTQQVPRVEKSKFTPDEKAIAEALEGELPTPESKPPANLDSIAENAVLVLATDPSASGPVMSFIRRFAGLLESKWHVGTRVEPLQPEEAKRRLEAGSVDVVVSPVVAAPTEATVPLFTRNGTTWSLAIAPDEDYERSLGDLVDSSLLTGEYGRLYADSFAFEPSYARAGRHFLADTSRVPVGTLFSTVPTDRFVEAAGQTGTADAYVAPSGRLGATVVCSPTPDSVFPIGTRTVTCIAHGPDGVEERASFEVTVQDKTKPTLNIRGPIEQEAASKEGAVVEFEITATDSVDGVFKAACSPSSGTRFAVGTRDVTCTATDDAGNTARGSFKVTVDDLPPILTVSPNISLPYTSRAGRAVSYRRASARDRVDGNLPATCRPTSGTLFRIGTTPVKCFATDSAGQRTDLSFSVQIFDHVAPMLTVPPSRAETAPAGARTHIVTFVTSAVDDIDGTVRVTCQPASGSPFPVGRTTLVSCAATDQSGNQAQKQFRVAVSSGGR